MEVFLSWDRVRMEGKLKGEDDNTSLGLRVIFQQDGASVCRLDSKMPCVSLSGSQTTVLTIRTWMSLSDLQ